MHLGRDGSHHDSTNVRVDMLARGRLRTELFPVVAPKGGSMIQRGNVGKNKAPCSCAQGQI